MGPTTSRTGTEEPRLTHDRSFCREPSVASVYGQGPWRSGSDYSLSFQYYPVPLYCEQVSRVCRRLSVNYKVDFLKTPTNLSPV